MTKRTTQATKKESKEFLMQPKVDICFADLLKNPKVRKGFCAAIVGRKPEEIKETILLPTILLPEYAGDKLGILDVRVLLLDGTQLDIEMQVLDYGNWAERSMFYLGKMFVDQLSEGEDYVNLKKCIHVGILDYKLFENREEYHSVFHLNEDTSGFCYSDKMEIHILELSKLPPELQSEDALLEWMRFFNSESKEDFEHMSEKNEYIKEACDTVYKLSADEEKRLAYEQHMKARRDYVSGLSYAERKGRTDILISLVQAGDISIEKAAVKLGVSVEEFQKLMK